MLYLDAPIGPIQGLMIYRDHEDRDLFYYVPERPRLALNDGVPEFIFLKYRSDITDNEDLDEETRKSLGGGFLSFTIDLGVDDRMLRSVKQELASFAEGEVRLAPIQFRKGSVRLSITKEAGEESGADASIVSNQFFEEVYGTSKPSLFGFNRATFSVVLTRQAATLFEAALREGISPIGVIYDLEFLGLRPAFHVHITAEYKRIYDHLEVEFGARGSIGVVSLAAEIDAAFQKLRDSGAIKVEIQNFTDDEDLRRQSEAAFDWFKKDLLKDFFKTALEPPTFMKRTASQGLLGQLQSLFGALRSSGDGQGASLTPTMGAPSTARSTSAPAPTSPDSGTRSTATANRGAAAATSQAGGGATAGSGSSSIAPFQVAFSLKYYRQDELKRREFDYSMQAAVARDAAPQGLFSTVVEGLDLDRVIKEVDLDDDFFKRLIVDVSVGTDLASTGIGSIGVNLEYPGEREAAVEPDHVDGFLFRADDMASKTFTTWLNEAMDFRYRYQMDVHFQPDSPWVGKVPHVTSDWLVSRNRQLTLNPLDEIGLFDLEISLGDMDSGQVSQVQAELLYEDAANNFRAEHTFVFTPGGGSQHWKLRLSDPELRRYRYRLTYFLQGNIRYQSDWEESEDVTLVINEPFRGTLGVRLVPLLDPLQLVEAVVNFNYVEAETGYHRSEQKVFTPASIATHAISLPTLVENPRNYGYDVTVIRLDGSVFESGPQSSESSALVISDGPGRVHRILVKLVNPNLFGAGLAYVKVSLKGLGEQGDRDEVLFSSNQTQDRMVALVQPDEGGPFSYEYQVTGYTVQGVPVPGANGSSSEPSLLVALPSG